MCLFVLCDTQDVFVWTYTCLKCDHCIYSSQVCVLYAGLGAGAGATLFGELARISTKRERTKVFSIYSTFRQVGLIFGIELL